MKKKLTLVFLCALGFLGTGCGGPSPVEQMQLTKNSFQNPTYIGEIHGRKLYQSRYVFGPYNTSIHYIYFFSDTNLVSVNYFEAHSKNMVNRTIVIDGKEFELKPR